MHPIKHTCRIAIFVVLASLPLRAQQASGTVTMSARVSGVANVSAASAAKVIKGDAQVSAQFAGAQGLILSFSGRHGGETMIEIPLQLRSNVDFALIVYCTANGATLSGLHVVEVRRAGEFVHPGAEARVEVSPMFEGRTGGRAPHRGGPNLLLPAAILTGPPISMRGTLDSPGNMIEVVLRIVLAAPDCEKGWDAELKLSTTPHAEAK